jgi:hypothetical protein
MEELQVPLDPSHMFDKPDVGEADNKESKLQWVEKKYRGSSGSSTIPPLVLIAILHYWGPCTESFPGSFSSKIVVLKPFRASRIF